MGFRGYLPVTYRSYYAITTWGPLMGPMLCTKESRYVRMQLRSTVCTRAYRKRVVMRLASLRLLHTPILRSTECCCSPCWKKRLHTKYNTFGTWRSSKRLHLQPPQPRGGDTRLLLPKLFHRGEGIGYSAQLPWLKTRRRHDQRSFFFYCLIETLGDALLRADLIYYPCDCTELLITEPRQLRR